VGEGLTKEFKKGGGEGGPLIAATLPLSLSFLLPRHGGGTSSGDGTLSPVVVVGGGRH